MPLESALKLDAALFDPALVTAATNDANAAILALGQAGPQWWEVGAAKYRQMRLDGRTVLPAPVILPQGRSLSVPSRDAGRAIPCRLFYPSSRAAAAEPPRTRGVVLHFHGGGWVLGSEETTDSLLQFYADKSGCVALSVGYRLAPEDPYPAAVHDCVDVAEWVRREGDAEFGGGLMFIGGESAGAHLSVLTTFHLLRTHPTFTLPGGLLLHFGAYDLTRLPSVYAMPLAPVLPLTSFTRFADTFLPGTSAAQRKHADISPLYEDLGKFRVAGGGSRLPTALFTCGTQDPLIDDSVLMAARWGMAGGRQVLRVFPGAVHGFLGLGGGYEQAGRGLMETGMFIGEGVERMGGRSEEKL